MANQNDVRQIALSFPGAREEEGRFAFGVMVRGKLKGFARVWQERVEPKKARVPNPRVLAVRVRDLGEKAVLLAGDPERFFTEPHYNGFPAILVRLGKVTRAQLRQLLGAAWGCQAPRATVQGEATAATVRKPRSRRASRPSR